MLSELNKTIAMLEARLPANIESPQNQKLAKSLEKEMAEYFRQIEQALPINEIEAIYYKLGG